MDINNLNNIPKQSGVYLWKNKNNTVIYVGKAKNLNNRMKQYFHGRLNSYKTNKLVSEINSFDYIITKDDRDALILERNLITKHTPKFNILLMDDKRYPYIRVKLLKDNLDIKMVRRVKQDKAIYFGPFPNGYGARRVLNLIVRLTKYKYGLPIKNASYEYWLQMFEKAKEILKPSNSVFKKELEQKIHLAAKRMQYEIAHDLNETLKALDFYSKSNVELAEKTDIDVIGIAEKDGYLSIAMMFYRQGQLLSKIDKVIEVTTSIQDAIRQFISQYYEANFRPKQIFINRNFLHEIIYDFKIINPIKGNNKKILDIATKNALDNLDLKLQTFVRQVELTFGAVEKLALQLGIPTPYHIQMVDTSSTNNTNPVSAIVSYKNGVKQKSEYKKFNLEIKTRKADVDYMRQTVDRYFSSEQKLPDLFIVDGGLAQFNEVKFVLQKKGISLPLIGLVKNDKHITKSLINLKGIEEPIKDSHLLNFLRGMQDEVDRFAKSHHRVKRLNTSLEGTLESIPGIGEKMASRLLREFGSYSAIYNATQEELEKITSKNVAKKIKEKYK